MFLLLNILLLSPILMIGGQSSNGTSLSSNSTAIDTYNQTEPNYSDTNGRSLFDDLPRQGRIINDEKISIKGFIPIVGIGGNDDDKNDKKFSSSSNQYSSMTSERNPQYQLQPQQPGNDPNPNSYDDVASGLYPQHQARPEDQRFIGAAIQGLIGNAASIVRGGNRQQYPSIMKPSQPMINRKSDCICVPFYMCRNGYIVGSGSSEYPTYHQRKNELQQVQSDDLYGVINERSLDNPEVNNTKFAEEILGRMIGNRQSSISDRCGILRTCCQRSNEMNLAEYLPAELIYGQQQFQKPNQIPINIYQPPPQLTTVEQHYQPQSSVGYPSHQMPPPSIPVPIHHHNRPYRPPKLIQHNPIPSHSLDHTQTSIPIRNDGVYGVCGQRQSIGINGRVQNLNYHQSSTEFAEFPWQVAILKRIGPSDNLYVCGGALIAPNFVLTAAHCLKKFQSHELKIRLGEWDVHREDEFYPYVEKNVDEVYIHPNFVPRNLMNDAALLRLDSEVDFNQNPHISTICLPQPFESFTGQRCYVAGWGKNAFGQQGEYQSVLMKVDLPVMESRLCENLFKQTKLGYQFRLDRSMICAGGEPGKDACEGDGGSGLVCETSNGIWKVAGLVSWGLGCGQANIPGVYTNVGHVRSWIDKIVLPYQSLNRHHHYQQQSYPNFNELINERSLGDQPNNSTIKRTSSNQTAETTTTTTEKP